MSKVKVHINQHVIRSNKKTGAREPVITVKSGKSNRYAHSVEIKGPSRVVYSPDCPLNCGAVCWVEVEGGVEVVLHNREEQP